MSGKIYIKSGDQIFYFDAVFSTGISLTGSVTRYAMSDRSVSSDHYVQEQDAITITGSVSEVKYLRSGSSSTSLEEFERGIKELKDSGRFFSIVCSKYLNPYHNCLFTSVDINRSKETGLHSIDVNMTARSVQVGLGADVVSTPVAARRFIDMVEEPSTGSSSGVESEEGTERDLSINNTWKGLISTAANSNLGKAFGVNF